MPKTEAQKRAQERYAQSDKGKTALKKAHQKIADTEEYRAYQREKQREYRRRRKLQATGSGADTSDSQNTKVELEETNLVPLVLYARIGVEPKVEAEVKTALRSLPNRSEYIRDAVIKQLREDGLLQPDQGSGSRGAA